MSRKARWPALLYGGSLAAASLGAGCAVLTQSIFTRYILQSHSGPPDIAYAMQAEVTRYAVLHSLCGLKPHVNPRTMRSNLTRYARLSHSGPCVDALAIKD